MNNWNGMSYKERKTIKILNKIKKIANDNHIPKKVVDQAIVIFNEISKGKIKRGKKVPLICKKSKTIAIKVVLLNKKQIAIKTSQTPIT
jgi:transcription initiation factor TFIIIB Brf1 subunit/transcription initiation factor TFIIB